MRAKPCGAEAALFLPDVLATNIVLVLSRPPKQVVSNMVINDQPEASLFSECVLYPLVWGT